MNIEISRRHAVPNQATLIAKLEPASAGLEPDSLNATWTIVFARG
jgi:hypothetical protein